MFKKEKVQSKKLTAKTPAVNISVKKINGRSFKSKDQIYKSKELDEKCSTVETETTVILHEKLSSKNVSLKKSLAKYLTTETFRLESPTGMGLIFERLPERLTLKSSTATI